MGLKDFRVDQKVTIEIKNPPFADQSYTSRIESIAGDRLILYRPLTKNGPVPVRVGEIVRVVFEGKYALYAFETSILAVKDDGKVPLMEVAPPVEFKKIQRREFFRVPAHLSVWFRIDSDGETGDFNLGTTMEISGGGLKLVSPVQLAAGVPLRLRIGLPGGEVDALGEVVRGEPGTSGNKYLAGIKFISIEERIRQRILDFVFDRQCEMRKLEPGQKEG